MASEGDKNEKKKPRVAMPRQIPIDRKEISCVDAIGWQMFNQKHTVSASIWRVISPDGSSYIELRIFGDDDSDLWARMPTNESYCQWIWDHLIGDYQWLTFHLGITNSWLQVPGLLVWRTPEYIENPYIEEPERLLKYEWPESEIVVKRSEITSPWK